MKIGGKRSKRRRLSFTQNFRKFIDHLFFSRTFLENALREPSYFFRISKIGLTCPKMTKIDVSTGGVGENPIFEKFYKFVRRSAMSEMTKSRKVRNRNLDEQFTTDLYKCTLKRRFAFKVKNMKVNTFFKINFE